MATTAFNDIAGQFTSRIFSSILWVGLALIVVAALGGTMWYFLIYKRKFNITVKINSERAGDKDNIIFDKAAILIDRKTRSKFFKLWSIGAELPVPPFNILQRTDKGDYIELRRTSEDKWYFLLPSEIDKSYVVRADGKLYPISEQKARIMEQDMEFWRVKRKQQNKGMFDAEQLWMKILPYIPYIMGGAITIFILYILMSYLPEILAQLTELSKSMNKGQIAEVTQGLILPLI